MDELEAELDELELDEPELDEPELSDDEELLAAGALSFLLAEPVSLDVEDERLSVR